MQNKEAEQLVSLIREIVNEALGDRDTTTFCVVDTVNNDGTVDVYIPPDETIRIKQVRNASPFTLKPGDIAVLYKIRNKLNNSFIISKY